MKIFITSLEWFKDLSNGSPILMRFVFAASIFVVGCLTGSLVGGYQCDYLGRRRSMMLDCGLMVLGFLAISLAPGWELLLLGRLLSRRIFGR